MVPTAVIKLGGSLIGSERHAELMSVLSQASEAGQRLVVVPGGGPFADTVREVCARHQPGDSVAHWMSVLAMDQHAYLIAGLLPRASLVHDPVEVERVLAAGRIAVLAPYAWLRALNPLPHSWEVCADSTAAWIAAELGSPLLVLLKSGDGISRGERSHLCSRAGLIAVPELDGRFADTLSPRLTCWIVNGRHPERLRELMATGETVGTRVDPEPAPRTLDALAPL